MANNRYAKKEKKGIAFIQYLRYTHSQHFSETFFLIGPKEISKKMGFGEAVLNVLSQSQKIFQDFYYQLLLTFHSHQ